MNNCNCNKECCKYKILYLQPKDVVYCKICEQNLKSFYIQRHVKTKKHLKNQKKKAKRGTYIDDVIIRFD